jgi:pilus assembly protein CpaB
MNKKAIIVLGLALIFGVLTAMSVNRMLRRGTNVYGTQPLKKVVVAADKIGLGLQIKPEQVSVVEWPESLAPKTGFAEVEKVVGRVTIGEIYRGEPIVQERLAPEGSAAGLAALIPPGMRAMTVKVDEVIGVAGFVAPGTSVDVVVTVVQGTGEQSQSRVILQNVKVLASGTRMEAQKEGQPIEVKTVTLQVTPDQAEILALASNAGRLQLVMRNITDKETVQTRGADTGLLFEGKPFLRAAPTVAAAPAPAERPKPAAKPAESTPAPPPPPPKTIELIRGGERTAVNYH